MCVTFLTGCLFSFFWFILLINESPLNLFTPGLVSFCYSWCFSRRAVFQTEINLPTSLSPTLRLETHPALRSVVPVQIKTLYPSSLKASPHLCISRFTEIFWSAVIKNFPRCPLQLHGQLIFPPPRTWSCGCEIKKEPVFWTAQGFLLFFFSIFPPWWSVRRHHSLISIYYVDPLNLSPASVTVSLGRTLLLIFRGILLCAAACLKLAPVFTYSASGSACPWTHQQH